MSIVFTYDDDDRSYCDDCSYLLIERKDGSRVCSNSDCGRQYPAGSLSHHKRDLQPLESRYDDGPLVVPMKEYGSYKKPKKPSVFDREDKHMASRSGFSWIDHEDIEPS
jgi:hypothetical protein